MRFMVGDLELNLFAMFKETSGGMHFSSVADKKKGASGWVSQEQKRGLGSVGSELLERE